MDKDDGDYEASAFEALERDFQEILQELVGDKSLEHFRQEYEKLHRALKKSHESEKSLIKKCRELNTEIVQNAVKVQTALKLSQEDQSTITALKKEIERAWKMVETSHEKEQRAKETIHNLKAEIAKLGRLVEQGAGLSINQENMVNQLVQEKNDLIKHRDMLQGQVGQLTQTNQDLGTTVQRLENERQQGGNQLQELRDQLENMVQDAEQQQRRKEQLDKNLKDLRTAMENRQNEINANREEKMRNEEHLAKVDADCRYEKQQIEELNLKHEKLEESREALKKANVEEQTSGKKLLDDKTEITAQLKNRLDEIQYTRKAKAKVANQLEALSKKKLEGDADKKKLVESTQGLKVGVGSLVKELEGMKRQAELDGKQIVDLLHERDILNKKMVKADENRKQQRELVRRHESQADTLAKDLQRWKFELQVKLHRIHELDRQREKYATELEGAKARFIDTCDLLKSRDDHGVGLKKNISDVKAKLGQQKNLYEAVRTDKNLYFKNLMESQEEISEMHKKFKTMNLQIEQLKEEIKEKDKVLMEVHFNSSKDSQLKEQIKKQLREKRNQLSVLTQAVDTQQQEIKKLEATIQDAEAEQQNQRKEFEAVTSERNILGTQLIRRNDELALLFEKIKIQESTLHKGEIQYRNKLEEIKKQRDNIAHLKRDLHDAHKQVENTDDLKKEVYHLQRDLLQERTKVKALSEELENPMNVHRWRKLEGADPAMYELIQKVRTLQKRLILKTEQVASKDIEIQEKERVHKDLMNMLEKQPGPEIMEQLELYQEQLGSKSGQMKAMQSELKTYQSQVGDYKDEIDRLTRELQEVKRKYFEQKKREQALQESQRGDTKAIHPRPAPMQRFTGGGFNLAH